MHLTELYGIPDSMSRAYVIHNGDWSGDIIIRWQDLKGSTTSIEMIPGEIIVCIAKTILKERIESKLMSAIDWVFSDT